MVCADKLFCIGAPRILQYYTSGFSEDQRISTGRGSQKTRPIHAICGFERSPGALFSGWLVSIECDYYRGYINNAHEVSGMFDINGLLVVSVPNLEQPSNTYILSKEFTGDQNTRIDAHRDGKINDLSIFGTIYDAIGLPDNPSDEKYLYGAKLVEKISNLFLQNLYCYLGMADELYVVNQNKKIFDIAGKEVSKNEFNPDPTGGDSFGAVNPMRNTTRVSAF